MIWCWQQDPEMRPTAAQVVEVAKSEQFCRLVDGVLIDNNARVLCSCQREIVVSVREKSKSSRMKKFTSENLELFSSFKVGSETLAPRSFSEGHSELSDTMQSSYDWSMSLGGDTLKRKVDAMHKYELWVSSSDVHSSCVTIIEYCEKFTGIKVVRNKYIICMHVT